jgi:hypothetical protein
MAGTLLSETASGRIAASRHISPYLTPLKPVGQNPAFRFLVFGVIFYF